MSVIYSDAWYDDMKNLINGSDEFLEKAPKKCLTMTLEVLGDSSSPYVKNGDAIHFLIVLDGGRVVSFSGLDQKHDGKGLNFRFTAPATLWEMIAAGDQDPITAGLRGNIKIRGDMRFLMQNADAVKVLVDLYGTQITTEWPAGKPPYVQSAAAAAATA